jgi:hypothetical protein
MNKIDMLQAEVRSLLWIKMRYVETFNQAEAIRIQKRIDKNWIKIEKLMAKGVKNGTN